MQETKTTLEVLKGLTLSELVTVLDGYASALRYGDQLPHHTRNRLVRLIHQVSIVIGAKVGG